MQEHNLKPHDLVAVSSVEMTHEMVARACKGRRLTLNTQPKVLAALPVLVPAQASYGSPPSFATGGRTTPVKECEANWPKLRDTISGTLLNEMHQALG